MDSSGGLSERPLGAGHRAGTRQDRELKQDHVPSQPLGCFWRLGDADAEAREAGCCVELERWPCGPGCGAGPD